MQARLQPNKRFIFRLSRPVNKGEPSQANPNGQEELDLYVFLLSSSALLFLSLSLSLFAFGILNFPIKAQIKIKQRPELYHVTSVSSSLHPAANIVYQDSLYNLSLFRIISMYNRLAGAYNS